MKRGEYLRFTRFMLPFRPPVTFGLEAVAMLSTNIWTMEGWLLHTLLVGGRIVVTVRIKECLPVLGTFRSGQITAIQGHYALTQNSLYQFLKVPPHRNETFSQFA